MTENHRLRLRALLAVNGDHTVGALTRICSLAVRELQVDGVGVTLVSRAGTAHAQQRLVHASDPISARLEDLQLTVGEGPGLTAVTSGAPVLVPDLAAARARWPAFCPDAQHIGAAALFAFPLTLGAIALGSLDCYRTTPGALSSDHVAHALMLAEMAFEALLSEVAGRAPDDVGWISDIHAEVHQATGMVSYQLGVSVQAALLRIRAYAYVHELAVAVVARRIVDRSLLLDTEN
ncbi:GAF and ANTAR domain-containing protein [Kutzneria sp. NPDC051319]|uniref:GAF and ANTAR domain-containing protein n=1 Tax=Kutzneria sp. NPDC051319 TaxID=3155047 RepID=UPI00341DF322